MLGRRVEGVLLDRARAVVTARSAKLSSEYNGQGAYAVGLAVGHLDKRILFEVGRWERIRAYYYPKASSQQTRRKGQRSVRLDRPEPPTSTQYAGILVPRCCVGFAIGLI